MSNLESFKESVKIDALKPAQLKELQVLLSRAGYNAGVIDGKLGQTTKAAWHEFKDSMHLNQPDIVGPSSIKMLINTVNGMTYDFSDTPGTIQAIRSECSKQGLTISQTAYVLATTEWETNKTFKPVREAYWLSEEWRKKNLRYYPYYGRGFVQITWKNNYDKYGKILGLPLVTNPDLALDPKNALFILVHGFKHGSFTGRKISDYINDFKSDYINARRCINGTDKATEIASLALKYI